MQFSVKKRKKCKNHIAFIGYSRESVWEREKENDYSYTLHTQHAICFSFRLFFLFGSFFIVIIQQEKPRCLSYSLHIADIFLLCLFLRCTIPGIIAFYCSLHLHRFNRNEIKCFYTHFENTYLSTLSNCILNRKQRI